ncbi:hypothetical protein ACWER9_31725, partial [Micromonospora sp. NPDC003944]
GTLAGLVKRELKGDGAPEIVTLNTPDDLPAALPDRSPQTSSTELGSRRDRSMPSSSAARNTSSSVSRISRATPSLESTSTLRHSDCSSLSSTLNDSGMPGSGMFSPLTMAS